MLYRLCILLALALSLSACEPEKRTSAPTANFPAATQPSPAQPTLVVRHVDTKVVSWGVSPLWLVRVEFELHNTAHTHVVLESVFRNPTTGVEYGSVRAYELRQGDMVAEYAVFYDGASPSGRTCVAYPATVSGADTHAGVAWLDEHPWGPAVTPWHLDISLPHTHLHPKAGQVVAPDRANEVAFTIDVDWQTNVTVRIP